jgi:hypothetical protein
MADLNGEITVDSHLLFEDLEFSSNDVRLMLKLEGAPFPEYHYYSEAYLKGSRRMEGDAFEWDIDLREAYLDLYEFISPNLDVRIGKQMIIWGTADKLNPTGNLCPDDLESTFDFGEKLGVNAINATYYLGNWMISAVGVPEFTPARLPSGDAASALGSPMSAPPGVTLRNTTTVTVEPERTLEDSSQFGLKLSGMLLDYDVSLSYFYGRDGIPLASKVTLMPVDLSGTMDVEAELTFPRIQVIGADFAGALSSVGVWGEAALFLPEEVDMPTYLMTSEGAQEQATSVALDDEAYLKYVLGMDYTFESGWYVQAQFLHGFIGERGKDNLNDYLVGRFEQSYLNDELTIVPFGFAVTVSDWDEPGENYAIAGMPEISYRPADNVELTLGAIIIEGKGDNMFSSMKENDEIFFSAEVSF